MSQSAEDKPKKPLDNTQPLEEKVGEGLTDDERVSREVGPEGTGARVTLGPADFERLKKP